MFVHGNEGTEEMGCHDREHDTVTRAVPFEDFGFDEGFGGVGAQFLINYKEDQYEP